MAGLSDNAAIILRIKADSTDAEKDLKAFKKELKEIDKAAKDAPTGLERLGHSAGLSAKQFDNLKVGALAAVAGIGAVVGVAATAAVALFNLTKVSAEFGSAIYDASIQTGLSARSVSALKLAADSSGSSLEKAAGAVSKLNVLMGQAANDNKKAQATLKEYGITATDTNEAFEQAVKVIGEMTDQGQKAAAMQALFKDRTAQMLGVIDQANGDFKAYTAEMERLGTTLTEKDIVAADNFGDALGVLSAQAKAAGVAFTSDLMVAMTRYFQMATEWYARNKDEVRSWGTSIKDIFRGVELTTEKTARGIEIALEGMARGFGMHAKAAESWADRVVAKLKDVRTWLYALQPLLKIMEMIGEANPALGDNPNYKGQFSPEAMKRRDRWDYDQANPDLPDVPSGSSSSTGKSKRDTSAEQARKDYQAEVARLQRQLNEAKATLDRTLSEAAVLLSTGAITELEFEDKKMAAAERTATRRLGLLRGQLAAARQYGQETVEIESEIAQQKENIQTIKNENQVKRNNQMTEAEKKAAKEKEERDEAAFQREIERSNERIRLAKELHEMLIGPGLAVPTMSDDKSNDPFAPINEGLEQLTERWKKLKAEMENSVGMQNILATLGQHFLDFALNMADAVEQSVAAWALYGDSIGQSLRKALAAQLAHIAGVATVNALFATALGFLRLAQWDFAGAANAFLSAGLWAALAGGTALGAKAVAGDSFARSTANGGASSGANNTQGTGQSQRDPNTFTSGQFGGFGSNGNQQNSGVIGRLNETLVVLEDTVHGLKTRIAAFSPGQVLGMGAEQNPNAISDSLLSGLSDNPRLTGGFKRAMGDAR